MKNSKFNEEQILMVQKNQELCKKVSEVCREFGISEPTFYKWKSLYIGMTLSDLQRVRNLSLKMYH